MKRRKGIAILALILVILTGVTWYAGTIISTVGIGESRNIKLGLDLQGGVSITYETVEENPSAEDMKDTVYKLQKRVESYSTEANVYQEGDNRINIEIPGVSDANTILEELGKPGSLEFQNASGETLLTGTDVADAQPNTGTDSTTGKRKYWVSLTFTEAGKEAFANATRDNLNKQLPVVYDGKTISNPTVNSVITDGQAIIEGMASYEEA